MNIFQELMIEISELRQSMQKMMQVVEDLQREVNDLKRSNSELRDIVRESHLVINKFPVNRTNWISNLKNRTVYHLTENGETFTVMASSTLSLRDDCAPHNLFTMVEGEKKRWKSEMTNKNPYVTLKYPKKVKCNYMRIKGRDGCLDECPNVFEIRGSNQEEFKPGYFKVLETIEGIKLAANEVKEFIFDNNEEFQYYSIFIIRNNGNASTSLSEMNFGYRF